MTTYRIYDAYPGNIAASPPIQAIDEMDALYQHYVTAYSNGVPIIGNSYRQDADTGYWYINDRGPYLVRAEEDSGYEDHTLTDEYPWF